MPSNKDKAKAKLKRAKRGAKRLGQAIIPKIRKGVLSDIAKRRKMLQDI